MSTTSSPRFLPAVMLADATLSLLTGIIQLAATPALAARLNLPSDLLVGTGWFFVAYSALAAGIGTRQPVPRALVRFVSVGNFGWAALCVLALLGPWLAPTGAGVAWVLMQAVAVAVLAQLQWIGLRRPADRLACA